jgi:hypothetical protein
VVAVRDTTAPIGIDAVSPSEPASYFPGRSAGAGSKIPKVEEFRVGGAMG